MSVDIYSLSESLLPMKVNYFFLNNDIDFCAKTTRKVFSFIYFDIMYFVIA